MDKNEISDKTIDSVAEHISRRLNQPSRIPIISIDDKSTAPHYYEIISFDKIDEGESRFFAVDGSYNSQEFYNGIYIGIYTAGYICFQGGKQIRLNESNDPVTLGKSYFPEIILITNDAHREAVFEELLTMPPVERMLIFFGADDIDSIWGLGRETKRLVTSSVSKLLSFCQEILEWSLVLEILESDECRADDYIFRDGTLRSNNIKQEYLLKIGALAKKNGTRLIAVTKKSPIKIELSSSFKAIDSHLENEKKPKYPFTIPDRRWQKLCCWFEVPDDVLYSAYPESSERKKAGEEESFKPTSYSMYAKRSLTGGRGFGLFFAARLDYVEKLQNYDWVVVDINIFDAIPSIDAAMDEQQIGCESRDINLLSIMFKEMTRLTQEHYILGYPYPLVEAHNFVTLKNTFKDETIKRVKAALYKQQMMDHVDIENMFLDIHERF